MPRILLQFPNIQEAKSVSFGTRLLSKGLSILNMAALNEGVGHGPWVAESGPMQVIYFAK